VADEDVKRSIMAVAETESSVWFIEIEYAQADGGHAVGSVYVRPAVDQPGQNSRQSLATNDGLSAMWASPTGSVWVGSVDGHVATTAAVRWPDMAGDVVYRSKIPGIQWTATRLPSVRSQGTPPNVSAIWGFDDQSVFLGTYLGHIYHWDGSQWAQVYDGQVPRGGTIRGFGGTCGSDVYAVGDSGVLLHFNGSGWAALTASGVHDGGKENFSGILTLPDGQVLVSASGTEGRLLQGTAGGLAEIARTPLALISMTQLGERVLFSTDKGVAELFGHDIRIIKSTFATATAWPGRGRAFFIEPTQDGPSYIQHDPRNVDRPWIRRKH
jgi:hypothetical protein